MIDAETRLQLLGDLWEKWRNCDRCGLCKPVGRPRRHVVFGGGNPCARLMIVGEAPGEEEDIHGEPFWPTAASGDLLDKFLASFDITREDVFIVNVVGCRPTRDDDPRKNRPPAADEIAACKERLDRIVEIVDPYVLLLLGDVAKSAMTRERKSVTALARDPDIPAVKAYTRGQSLEVERQAVVTFHPAYLARNFDMSTGSDTHLVYLAFEKAVALVRAYEHLYFNAPMPAREDT